MHTPSREIPVLLYDGDCGFCAASVHFVLAHESAARAQRLRFAPLQGTFAGTMRTRFPALDTADSVVWYEPSGEGRILLYSDAALAVLRHLGGTWRVLGVLARMVPHTVRDAVYRAVARRRLSLAAPACLLPNPSQRARFLP